MPERTIEFGKYGAQGIKGHEAVARRLDALAGFIATPVTARRGLLYFDDGASPRSLASQLAGASNLPFVKAGITLDAVPTPEEIDRALAKLEGMARERGVAVGVISALPVSVTRLSRWSKGIESRGFVLVPISTVATKAKSS